MAKTSTASVPGAQRMQDVLNLEASDSFIQTPQVKSIAQRALTYLHARYPIHFSGPPGVGKTTLAFHIATMLGTPIVLLHGDDEFGTSDLVGRDNGVRKERVIDNYIHSVTKVQEETRSVFVSNRQSKNLPVFKPVNLYWKFRMATTPNW